MLWNVRDPGRPSGDRLGTSGVRKADPVKASPYDYMSFATYDHGDVVTLPNYITSTLIVSYG